MLKNTTYNIKTWKSARPIQTGKEIGATYCLGRKDYSNNFKPQEVKMTNKVLREKWNCVICRSSKARFLKKKHKNKKQFLQIINKTCKFIVKTVKTHSIYTFKNTSLNIKQKSKSKIKMRWVSDW